jgi:bacteriorhodopsin
MNAPHKRSKAKEYLWLAVALMCLVVAVHSTLNRPFKESWYYYAFALVAYLLYRMWRTLRKKSENG